MIISATMEDDEARYREFYKEIDVQMIQKNVLIEDYILLIH